MDAEIRDAERLLEVKYGDVDAGLVSANTRKLYGAVDILLEAQRKAMNMPEEEMIRRRRLSETSPKVMVAGVAGLLILILLILTGPCRNWDQTDRGDVQRQEARAKAVINKVSSHAATNASNFISVIAGQNVMTGKQDFIKQESATSAAGAG